MVHPTVTIQISEVSVPSTPSWLGEAAAFAHILRHLGQLEAIEQHVRFARARFGYYDTLDFIVVLIGYAVSGEPTLKAFYERLSPFAEPFMALFGRHQLPHRSTLSRFLAALDHPTVEALRTLFQEDLLARNPFTSPGGVFDRVGKQWVVVDVDGTKQAARQRVLPQTESLPTPHRRFDQVCAPGYQGRKRGEVVRTRTVMLQAHTHQFLGTFGGPGNGDYRGDLLRAIQVITSYATKFALPTASVLLRLDGLYGDAAPLVDVLTAGLGVIARSRDYHLLDLEVVQQALAHAPDQVSTHPESGMTRALYDCPAVPLTPAGPQVRLVVATHDAPSSSPTIGVERDGTVYELFVSTLPSPAFEPSDVLDLYLHRGSFETVLADEDQEQNSDRWYSHTPCGQEFCQTLALISSGTSAWNWGRSSPRQNCARRNLPKPWRSRRHLSSSRLLPSSLCLLRNQHRRFSMVLLNGLVLRLREAFPVPLLPCNRMGRCVAPLIVPSTHKSAGWSATAPFGCCMLHASVIVEAVPCVRSVKKAVPA